MAFLWSRNRARSLREGKAYTDKLVRLVVYKTVTKSQIENISHAIYRFILLFLFHAGRLEPQISISSFVKLQNAMMSLYPLQNFPSKQPASHNAMS